MTSEIDVVEKLKRYFGPREDICFAFLFGSYARGKTFGESDIDIAIYHKEGYSFELIKKIWRDLEGILGKDVDLLVLNTSPPLIGYTAIRGMTLVVNDYRAYLNYLLRISQEAEDFREFFFDIWRLRQDLKRGVQ